MSFSSGWGSFPGECSVIQGYQYGGQKNRGCQKMAWTKVSQDIQVFLGFANFYWRFIQGFSKIAAPLTSMLKTTWLPDVSGPEVGNGSGKVVGLGVGGGGGDELAKKSGKSKSQKTSKFRKSAKSGKDSSKSENSPNFDATEIGPSFVTPKASLAFNRLWLAFTEAPILWHFDPKCHIWIETNISGYVIGGVLSQLASGTSPYRVVTKVDLG